MTSAESTDVQTGDHLDHIGFARDPEELVARIARAYNTRDTAAVDRLFEPDSVIVVRPGVPATGAERRRVNTEFLDLGFHFTITVRHVYHQGDIALLLADHVLEGTGPDGQPVRMEGTATDVIRRGPDGYWRYVIDNPWGTNRTAGVK